MHFVILPSSSIVGGKRANVTGQSLVSVERLAGRLVFLRSVEVEQVALRVVQLASALTRIRASFELAFALVGAQFGYVGLSSFDRVGSALAHVPVPLDRLDYSLVQGSRAVQTQQVSGVSRLLVFLFRIRRR